MAKTEKIPPKGNPHPNPQPQVQTKTIVAERAEALEDLKVVREQKMQLLDELISNVDNYKKYTDYDAPWEHLDVLLRTVCKKLTYSEFYYYLQVCHQLQLDPYLKQVWCYKDSKDNLITMVGRDGYLVHCQKQDDFEGLSSAVIYESDTVVPNYHLNTIEHVATDFMNRGKIVGAWAICKRSGFDDRLVTVYFDEYTQEEKNKFGPWVTNPSSMIMKVAELESMRKQFPLSGLQNEHDWVVSDDGIVKPIDKSKNLELKPLVPNNIKEQKRLIDQLDLYTGKDKEEIRKKIINDRKNNLLTNDRIKEYMEILSIPGTEEEE